MIIIPQDSREIVSTEVPSFFASEEATTSSQAPPEPSATPSLAHLPKLPAELLAHHHTAPSVASSTSGSEVHSGHGHKRKKEKKEKKEKKHKNKHKKHKEGSKEGKMKKHKKEKKSKKEAALAAPTVTQGGLSSGSSSSENSPRRDVQV